jgi:type 1 glutamine amidotransferase
MRLRNGKLTEANEGNEGGEEQSGDMETDSKVLKPKKRPGGLKWSEEAIERVEVSLRDGEAKAGTCPRSPKRGWDVLGLILASLVVWPGLVLGAEAKTRVLVVTGGHGFDKEPFLEMFSANHDIEFTAAEHSKANASVYDREDLLSYEVVVLYDMPQKITEAQRAKFMGLFEKGVGLVVLHHALVSYQKWAEYEAVIGGRYEEPDANQGGKVTEAVGWQHDVDVPVVIVATNHPITAGLKDFTIHDEIYWGFRVGTDVRPLITTTQPKSGKPLGWVRKQGRSRVVYLQPGHGPTAFTNKNYRQLLAQAIGWAAEGRREASLPRVFLLEAKHLAATRERIEAGDKSFGAALAELEKEAQGLLKAKTVSVMDKARTPPSGDRHDYMSEAPYFWPNPQASNGLPYVRRDGERNPEINQIPDHGNILGMPEKVQTLGLAYYFTGKEEYASKAAEFLRVWFLNTDTRMNPHFEYAQAIRGVNNGRGIGLIESRGLTRVVDGVGLLAGAKAWRTEDQAGLERWFSDFLGWMLESRNGREEAAGKNNHGTYYDIQVASYAMFLGKWELAKKTLEEVRTKRIAAQIEPDGRQPLELARTKAWSYSIANLSGLMSLAKLGECVGLDLWNYETADGRGIRKAFDFLTPFALREKPWGYEELGGWSPGGFTTLARQAALKFSGGDYSGLAAKVVKANGTERANLLMPASKSRIQSVK